MIYKCLEIKKGITMIRMDYWMRHWNLEKKWEQIWCIYL